MSRAGMTVDLVVDMENQVASRRQEDSASMATGEMRMCEPGQSCKYRLVPVGTTG